MNHFHCVTLLGCLALTSGAEAYPIDAEQSGIGRLAGYQAAQLRPTGSKLPSGALLGTDEIKLQLLEQLDWDLADQPEDLQMRSALQRMFANRDRSYGLALVDITDPQAIRWAGLQADRAQVPGSVGKVLCMLALFDGLKRAFPDIEARQQLLREHRVTAGDWVISDEHKVPRFDPATGQMRSAIIRPGEVFTLAEWLDHMISASANSAGSTIWKEALLLRAFGADYPPSPETESRFFKETPVKKLSALSQAVINDALADAGLADARLKVGNFWTQTGKRRIPGPGGSVATPRSLVRFLLRLEQGRLVDTWSSLEMKRYLYMTKRRYRYAYAPELNRAAVFFKSGSLYRCKPEPEFSCGKYRGNLENAMNSVAIIESPARADDGKQRRYLVALTSNVLRVNSAWDHSRIGAAIEELINRGQAEVRDRGSEAEIKASGVSD